MESACMESRTRPCPAWYEGPRDQTSHTTRWILHLYRATFFRRWKHSWKNLETSLYIRKKDDTLTNFNFDPDP